MESNNSHMGVSVASQALREEDGTKLSDWISFGKTAGAAKGEHSDGFAVVDKSYLRLAERLRDALRRSSLTQ